jgi:methylase of polypeptide subunit release factors
MLTGKLISIDAEIQSDVPRFLKRLAARASAALETLLTKNGVQAEDAHQLCETWLIQGDFLLAELPAAFDYVVGNPPYVRQEMIPDALLSEYRHRYSNSHF